MKVELIRSPYDIASVLKIYVEDKVYATLIKDKDIKEVCDNYNGREDYKDTDTFYEMLIKVLETLE